MITRARSYGVTLGIYTNWYDWYQITASSNTFQQYNLPLWYWNSYGFGSSAEGPANFNDFRAFGSWSSPVAKEYAFNENCCSAIISKIAYSTSSSFSKLLTKHINKPIAGSAIL